MPEYLKFPIVLFCVTVGSAVVLSSLHHMAEPRIQERKKEEENAAEEIAFPGAEKTFEKQVEDPDNRGKKISYKEVFKAGKKVGYLVKGSASGYSSTIEVLVGVDKNFVVRGVKILFQQETPGLGTRIEEVPTNLTWIDILKGKKVRAEPPKEPWFTAQYKGLRLEEIKLKSEGGKVDAITGATISSRAVTRAVREAVEKLKKALGT